jgi:hypothetical protein
MFGLMPEHGIVDEGMHPPVLKAGQKFKLAIQYFDPYTFAFVAAEAGINQAFDSPKEYGQGAEAYGKRYGAPTAPSLPAFTRRSCARIRATTAVAPAVSSIARPTPPAAGW